MLSQIPEQKVTANGLISVNGGIYVGRLVIWGGGGVWPRAYSRPAQKNFFSPFTPTRGWGPQPKGKSFPFTCVKEYGEVEI